MDKVVVKQFQDEILDALDEILAVNEISLDLYFSSVVPRDFTEEEVTEEEEASTELSVEAILSTPNELSLESDTDVSDELISKGESSLEGFTEVESVEVDYDNEEELDAKIDELNKVELSTWQKIVNLATTGVARPNSKSSQDKEIDGVQFKVRYRYAPLSASDDSREFCKKMVSANKLYRKEDIVAMKGKSVNAGFGKGGADTYSIWDYKGGARCNHKWQRVTFASDEKISTGKAERQGYRVRNESNAAIKPTTMPNDGFAS